MRLCATLKYNNKKRLCSPSSEQQERIFCLLISIPLAHYINGMFRNRHWSHSIQHTQRERKRKSPDCDNSRAYCRRCRWVAEIRRSFSIRHRITLFDCTLKNTALLARNLIFANSMANEASAGADAGARACQKRRPSHLGWLQVAMNSMEFLPSRFMEAILFHHFRQYLPYFVATMVAATAAYAVVTAFWQ